ncbi:MAG: hypothetical protein QXE86_06530 [Archaeoglobaceae archaeon]
MRWKYTALVFVLLVLIGSVEASDKISEKGPVVWKFVGEQKGGSQGKTNDNDEKGAGDTLRERDRLRDRIFNETKEKMQKWTENCYSWLERLQSRIDTYNFGEETKLRIQERIRNLESRLKQIESELNSANDSQSLKKAGDNIKEFWKDAGKEMRNIAYEIQLEKIRDIVDKLKNLVDRFKSLGLDTTELEKMINEIEVKLAEIESKIVSGEVSAKDFSELNRIVQKAFDEVKKLSKEYLNIQKSYRGILLASINGNFTLTGNLSATIVGSGDLSTNPENAIVNAKNATSIVVRGKDVKIEGNGSFKIVAHGSGIITMHGVGAYKYKECISEEYINGTFSDGVTISFGTC